MYHINSIPIEIRDKIFDKLPDESKWILQFVCKEFGMELPNMTMNLVLKHAAEQSYYGIMREFMQDLAGCTYRQIKFRAISNLAIELRSDDIFRSLFNIATRGERIAIMCYYIWNIHRKITEEEKFEQYMRERREDLDETSEDSDDF